jgi:hypothetical protein
MNLLVVFYRGISLAYYKLEENVFLNSIEIFGIKELMDTDINNQLKLKILF